VAIGATSLVNGMRDNTRLDRKAVTGVTFNRLLGELDNVGVQERMAAAESAAEEANAALLAGGAGPLATGPTHQISLDARDRRLAFIGFGTSDEQAAARALEMRERYLDEQALDGTAEIDRRISVIAAQLDDVFQSIEEVTAEAAPTAAEFARDSRIAELQAEVGALAGRYGALTVEMITPAGAPNAPDPPRTTTAILSERGDVREAMLEAQTELTGLELERDSVEPENAALALLRTRESQLRLALDTLVASRITEEPIGSLDPVETSAARTTTTPTSVTLVVGLLAGLIVGLVGLMLVDRLRRPLWTALDVEPQYRLPQVPRRSPAGHRQTETVWYTTAPPGGRKTGIQQLRSNVEGLAGFGSNLAIGLAAVHGHSRDVHELAADLASSLAGPGSRALLIDVDFEHPSGLIEFEASGLDVDDLLHSPEKVALLSPSASDTQARCVGISAGDHTDDSPDLLAQHAFAHSLDAAREAFDVVIVVSPPSDSATYHVLTQRLDGMILVAAAGETLSTQVDAALHTLDDGKARPIGVVLLTRASGRFSGVIDWINGRSSEPETDEDLVSTSASDSADESVEIADAAESGSHEKVPAAVAAAVITDASVVTTQKAPKTPTAAKSTAKTSTKTSTKTSATEQPPAKVAAATSTETPTAGAGDTAAAPSTKTSAKTSTKAGTTDKPPAKAAASKTSTKAPAKTSAKKSTTTAPAAKTTTSTKRTKASTRSSKTAAKRSAAASKTAAAPTTTAAKSTTEPPADTDGSV
jgi:Mrp family chromosome partitioning ATPase